MTIVLVVMLSTLINHVRGGGGLFGAAVSGAIGRIPGRPIYYTWVLMGLVAWLVVPWQYAITTALTNLTWGLLPWGRWFRIGARPRKEEHDWFTDAVEQIGGDDDFFCFALRNAVALMPAALLIFAPMPALSGLIFLQPLAYLGVQVFSGDDNIGWCELLTGAIWGALIAFSAT